MSDPSKLALALLIIGGAALIVFSGLQIDDFLALPAADRASWVQAVGTIGAILASAAIALGIETASRRRLEQAEARTKGRFLDIAIDVLARSRVSMLALRNEFLENGLSEFAIYYSYTDTLERDRDIILELKNQAPDTNTIALLLRVDRVLFTWSRAFAGTGGPHGEVIAQPDAMDKLQKITATDADLLLEELRRERRL